MVDAREYHERTNHTPQRVRSSGRSLDPSTMPRPFKRYRDLDSEPLSTIRPPMQPALSAVAHDRADPLAGTGQSPRGTLDREAIATLCYEAGGIVQHVQARDGRDLYFRAASCTGNLHHIDCYLVCSGVEGIADGVYHFDPASFSLDVLREGDYRGALAAATGDATAAAGVESAPATVVVTSTWERNAWKYGDRTYRHAFWDAGAILANLLAAAHALDYPAAVLAAFADRPVADLLGVDPAREAPIAVVPVGDAAAASSAEASPAADSSGGAETPSIEPIDPAIDPPTDDPADVSLVADAWAQSSLGDGAAAAEWRATCRAAGSIGRRSPAADASAAADGIPLDPVDPATATARPLHYAIQRRGSCREYADDGPSFRQVSTVLDRALRAVPSDWHAPAATAAAGRDGDGPDAAGATPGLAYNDAYLLATGVEGLEDGAYHVRDGGTLERVGDATVAAKRHLALDQDWAGDAHVNVYLLADVDAVVERLGNRGYRLAQLEAGIALGRLYLATYAHRDLGGTGLTFYDDLVADRLAPSRSNQTPTCLFALGASAR